VTVAGVLLAAGAGSRFAGPTHKLLAALEGRPVIDWALGAVTAAGFDDVVVVVRDDSLDGVIGARAAVVRNPDWAEGMGTSLAVARRWAAERGHDAIVVGLADQPHVPASAWRAVAAAVTTPVAVATYGGQRRNPVRLHRDVWDELPTTGDEGARRLLRLRPDLVTEVPCDGSAADVDTVADLSALEGPDGGR
jgi:molybdenum cofactor cytidylyltransferase